MVYKNNKEFSINYLITMFEDEIVSEIGYLPSHELDRLLYMLENILMAFFKTVSKETNIINKF